MATWEEMSQDCLLAAQKLLTGGHLRSSVSRSYYAAYCAISRELARRGVAFAHGWNNPSHDQLPALVRNGLRLSPTLRGQVGRAIRRLRAAREDADYRPGVSIDRTTARSGVHDAILIIRAMEGSDD